MNQPGNRERIRGQVKEAYGKLLYTYQTQQEAASLKRVMANRLSLTQIALTAISTCGVISIFFGKAEIGAVVASLLAAVSLGINLYVRGANLLEEAENHARCANRLWVLMQDYISLLTDFDGLDLEEIREKRESLFSRQAEMYAEAPRTNDKAYARARARLKDGHQSFDPGECDKLLPIDLRGNDGKDLNQN